MSDEEMDDIGDGEEDEELEDDNDDDDEDQDQDNIILTARASPRHLAPHPLCNFSFLLHPGYSSFF